MLHSRKEREKLEESCLAPYAVRSAASRGRLYPEPPHDVRAEFQRDRDRVLYSKAFRRLEYKTQVFVNGTADHYRTRLTHTMEMTAVGRTLARALRANEDLVEAIALAHDIGHSPFGHVGEEALDELMKQEGGFDHNLQSCRAVELIEHPYPDFPGLNLTWEVRAGLRKHLAAQPGAALDGHPLGPRQFLEAQIADVADDIAYYAHDVDDGLEAGLISASELAGLEIWREAQGRLRVDPAADGAARATVRALLDLQVEDVLQTGADRVERFRPASPADVMSAPEKTVDFSPRMKALLTPLRTFLFERLYYNPAVSNDSQAAVRMMRRLFLHYIAHPDVMGRKARARLASEGLWRTVCDYIAGMTDRYAMEEFERFKLNQ
ncbi:MAG TPA: deoxyguanosinetriphosphate triphosphohydrolase [Kiritimatiellia bacterium]|nr:deoxyguanosinetriphosphate triphosphohydrolase [Kiritimatiellia bacterium]HRZ11652.1 deoxyguanosinetriphosphate triphosphohydrolase [Kiritimatiellia bacterium]HSA16797.1 deoxyguanosinetriphosphate triphosphohydrolase [Kiritimatiellia bacterium]